MQSPRGTNLRRLWLTGELVGQSRFGRTAESIHEDVCDRMGQRWHQRTTQRDLELLAEIGVIEQRGGYWRLAAHRVSSWFAADQHAMREAG